MAFSFRLIFTSWLPEHIASPIIMEENDVNRSAIQEQIKLQGEVVRKLKADKAEKDKVSFSLSVY